MPYQASKKTDLLLISYVWWGSPQISYKLGDNNGKIIGRSLWNNKRSYGNLLKVMKSYIAIYIDDVTTYMKACSKLMYPCIY